MKFKLIHLSLSLVPLLLVPVRAAPQSPPAQNQQQEQNQQQNQQQNQLQDQAQTVQTADVRSFSGRISQKSGRFYLEDSIHKQSFLLDNDWLAKRNMGTDVVVTGALDENTNTIHVRSMKAAAKSKKPGSPPKPAWRE